MTVPEIVSELINANKPLAEIAGYDNTQMLWIVFRARDKYGRLKRKSGLPPWIEVDENGMRTISNPVSFGKMFHQVRKKQGFTDAKAKEDWQKYLEANPKLGKGGDLT